MKRFILILLAAVMLLSMLAPVAYASETGETTEVTEETRETEETEETEADEEEQPRRPESTAKSGTCGDMTWELDGTTLTITGSGEMEEGAPWSHLADQVKKLVLAGGVTTVAEEAFRDFDELTVIDFGSELKEIGARAFMGCDSLTSICMPPAFRRFGPESFLECTALEAIYCAGNMPSFKAGCLSTGNYIAIYRPVDNPWPQEEVQRLQQNFGSRLEILAASGEEFEAYTKTVAEEAAVKTVSQEPETEPTAEPTVEPTTEPVTEPATEPTTQPVTEPASVPTEAAVTEAVEDTGPDWREELEQTEAAETEEDSLGGRSWIGLVLIIGVLTFIVAGALIVRGVSRKGGRYSD